MTNRVKYHSQYKCCDHVYAVRSANGDIKIGFAFDLHARMSKLKAKVGDVEILGVLPGGRELEQALHLRFRPFCITLVDKIGRTHHTEWFTPSIELYAFIGGEMNRFVPREVERQQALAAYEARQAEKARERQKRITDWQAQQTSEQEKAA